MKVSDSPDSTTRLGLCEIARGFRLVLVAIVAWSCTGWIGWIEAQDSDAKVDALAERRDAEVLEPFLKAAELEAKAGGDLSSALRVFVRELDEWIHSNATQPRLRVELLKGVQEKLVSRLRATGGAGARWREIVRSAFAARVAERRDGLHRQIICWCPKENWTKTLEGCTDGCAMEQKGLINTWLAAGLSDAEIIDRMVNHPKGGVRVRADLQASGANVVAYIIPALFVLVAIVVWIILVRGLRRGRAETQAVFSAATTEAAVSPSMPAGGADSADMAAASATPSAEERGDPQGANDADAGDAHAGDAADEDWDERIERELKEMDS